MKSNLYRKEVFRSIFLGHDYIVPATLFIAAIVVILNIYFASKLIGDVRTKINTKAETSANIYVAKKNISPSDMDNIVLKLSSIYPTLNISQRGTGVITIEGTSLNNYQDWLSAVYSLQGFGDSGTIWATNSLCIGNCIGKPLHIDIKGYRQTVEEKNTN